MTRLFCFLPNETEQLLINEVRGFLPILLFLAALGVNRAEAAKKEAPVKADLRAVLISEVRPEYPYEARRDHAASG